MRAKIKGKVFQLRLLEDVQCDKSSVQRSQTTGHILLTMPKCRPIPSLAKSSTKPSCVTLKDRTKDEQKKQELLEVTAAKTVREMLNISSLKEDAEDIPPLEEVSDD